MIVFFASLSTYLPIPPFFAGRYGLAIAMHAFCGGVVRSVWPRQIAYREYGLRIHGHGQARISGYKEFLRSSSCMTRGWKRLAYFTFQYSNTVTYTLLAPLYLLISVRPTKLARHKIKLSITHTLPFFLGPVTSSNFH
jgi:hypothetical protein